MEDKRLKYATRKLAKKAIKALEESPAYMKNVEYSVKKFLSYDSVSKSDIYKWGIVATAMEWVYED